MWSCLSYKGSSSASSVWLVPLPSRVRFCTRTSSFCTRTSSVHQQDLLVQEALNAFDGHVVEAHSYASLLRNPAFSRSLHGGRQVHHHMVVHGHEQNAFLDNLLVQMYAKCLDLNDAYYTFNGLQERNIITWNLLLRAFDAFGFCKETLYLFDQMLAENVVPDKCTYVCVLSAYAAAPAAVCEGKYLHARILSVGLHLNFVVATALVHLYGKCEDIEPVCDTFEGLLERDIVSWNALIAAYAQLGLDKDAFQVFEQLHQEGFLPDGVTLVHVLSSFARPVMLPYGKRIHAALCDENIGENVVVATALANMYGKCSCLHNARQIFYHMHKRNVVTWNAMIAVFAHHEHGKEAIQLYQQMKLEDVVLNKVTYVSVLDACASEKSLFEGQMIHVLMTKFGYDVDVVLGTALMNMYNNCGSLQEGQRVFDLLPEPNVVSWNVMITGYNHHGYGKEALQLFDGMEERVISLDDLTAIAVLTACGLEAALVRGQFMHSFAVQCGFETDVTISNTILNMYGKCGRVDEAQSLFNRMNERSLVSWNSMVGLYAQHGICHMVFQIFYEMQVEGVIPNETTLLNIMCMGSHTGLVRDCVYLWVIMINSHNIYPTFEHFDAMVDIFGRAGQLDMAEYLINKMPVQPTALSWTTLLSSCRSSADVVRGQLAAKSGTEMDIADEVTYITLFNIFAFSEVNNDESYYSVAV